MQDELTDGNLSFRGGQNAGTLPDRIREDQYAYGINITTKDGGAGPRPGFVFTDITVTTEGGVPDVVGKIVPYQEILHSGKFQGAHAYITESLTGILAVVSGVIFVINPVLQTAEVLEIEEQEGELTGISPQFEPSSQRLDQYAQRFNISNAGRFVVIHDYPDTPVIIEGGVARRADPDAVDEQGNPAPELFASVLGTYNQSRYFFSSIANEFTAGDPVGSTAAPDAPITVLEIGTTAAPFVGQVFSLGSTNQNKPITAMGFTQVMDSSTGLGPMFVATKDSIYTFRTDLPRTQWEQTQFGRLLLFNAGIAGQRAFVQVNTDLMFISGDGRIRSLLVSASGQQKFANTPIDREVQNWNVMDDPELMSIAVAEAVGNRVFFTVSPYRTFAQDLERNPVVDYAFEGMVVLELDNLSGLLADAAPAWAGLWTGIQPMDIVNVDGTIWIFSKDEGVNALYRMDESLSYDIYKDQPRNIVARIYTREYPFQDRFKLKKEKFVEPTFSNVRGDMSCIIDRKTEASGKWLRWREWRHNAIVDDCEDACCDTRPVLQEQSFRDLNFGSPEVEGDCDPITREDLRYFKRAQYRLTISARNWKLQTFRAVANLQEDAQLIHGPCEHLQRKLEKDCSDVSDWLLYSVPFKGDEVCL